MEQEVNRGDSRRVHHVLVTILTGAGKGFCSGADMSLLSAISQEASPRADFLFDMKVEDVRADFQKKHAWLLTVPKPIIAGINGPAVGLGLIVPL
jgi:enoyl-CoA hydratase/carnithine racemase